MSLSELHGKTPSQAMGRLAFPGIGARGDAAVGVELGELSEKGRRDGKKVA
jgi:hypothetical protein